MAFTSLEVIQSLLSPQKLNYMKWMNKTKMRHFLCFLCKNISGIIMGLCCFKGDGDNDKGTQRQKVKAVYKAPAANKKAKQSEPAVPSQTKIDRRKSMATRAVPIAPDNKGGDTPKEVGEILVAVYDFKGDGPEELNFFEGDKIELIEEFSDGWAKGRLCDDTGGTGLFPLNYTMGKGGRV